MEQIDISLKGKQKGDFLVYKNCGTTNKSAHFIISYVTGVGVRHTAIEGHLSKVGLVTKGDQKTFDSLPEIISSRKDLFVNPIQLKKTNERESIKSHEPTFYGSLDFELSKETKGRSSTTPERPLSAPSSPKLRAQEKRNLSQPVASAAKPQPPVPSPSTKYRTTRDALSKASASSPSLLDGMSEHKGIQSTRDFAHIFCDSFFNE